MFSNILRDIRTRVEGTLAVSLVGLDGIAVESINDGDVPLDLMGAEFGGFIKSIRLSNTELDTGDVLQLSVMTAKYAAYVSAINPEYYLLLVLKPDGNQGRARFELTRAKQQLRDELG